MKKIALLLLGLTALGASQASAQNDAPAIVNRASIFYDLNTLSPKAADNAYYNGYGLGYTVDFRVSNSMPLYVGTGLDIRFLFHNNDYKDNLDYDRIFAKVNCTLINLNLPVNVSYRVPVTDDFFMTPFAGLDFRVQVYGNASIKTNGAPVTIGEALFDEEAYIDNSINLFSRDDMGGARLRRFQMGWHAGLNFEYRRFNLGLSFGTDFVKIHKNTGGSNFLVSLGYTF